MMIKYRVHEVAKDFNVPSKEIISLIKENTGAEKKHMTALTKDELDLVFEHFSKEKQVENFDDYLAGNLDLKFDKPENNEIKSSVAKKEDSMNKNDKTTEDSSQKGTSNIKSADNASKKVTSRSERKNDEEKDLKQRSKIKNTEPLIKKVALRNYFLFYIFLLQHLNLT